MNQYRTENSERRVGIFGGTFDPVHFGHLRSAEEIREALVLDKVVFMPSYIHPFKSTKDVAEADHRLAMVKLAIASNPFFEVSDFEIRKRDVSYTTLTLEHFNKEFPNEDFYFIVGVDGWNEITLWYEYRRIFELASVVVHNRSKVAPPSSFKLLPPEDAENFRESDNCYIHKSGKKVVFVAVTELEISATEIRKRVRGGKSARYLTPDSVLDYIDEHRLYR